jgi:hypothetical protein
MATRPVRRLSLLCLCLVAISGAAAMGGMPSRAAAAGWPMYHLDPGRSGNDTGEPSFAGVGSAWTSAALDGAVYAEPLVNGSSVIVATENNSLYAFDAATGAVRWGPVNLGAPRTANFPCGDINPLGITGTPVIDGGYLYVLADVQVSSTVFEFHLAKVDPSSGAVVYNANVSPSGMVTANQQERSALAVSSGNVVVVYGGLDGDCAAYHGYVETVAESSGAVAHQWNDTSGGREGGIWAPSGPAVDSAGNIYVSTGNGSSSSITNYDYGDSVLEFNGSLTLLSFFAPGSPQTWSSLNANDQDLGSMGPSLLPNTGQLFAIGKGGRGYLLNQGALPSNSNPGGGESFSAAVCTNTSDAAFGGLAVSGSTVFVPCKDGIAAVSVDSSTSFHTLWYDKAAAGGGPPIVASGFVWTVDMFGGTTLYGLDKTTGVVSQTLTLPATTEHFVTPAAGDGRLFVAAANKLAAFAPPPPGDAGVYHPMQPTRICDTRAIQPGVSANQCNSGSPSAAGPVGANGTLTVDVCAGAGSACTLTAVAVNVTATDATTAGFLTVYPTGAPRPNSSNLNVTQAVSDANLVEVAVGSSGTITVFSSVGSVDVVIDLEGTMTKGTAAAGTAGLYTPIPPARICDTRPGGSNSCNNGGAGATLGPNGVLNVQVTGMGGVPSGSVSAVVVNLTATDTTARSFLTAWPAGTPQPTASNVNWSPGQIVPNRVAVRVGTNGQISIYNLTGSVDVVVDVNGWYGDGTEATVSGTPFTPIVPTRICDTRADQVGVTTNQCNNGGAGQPQQAPYPRAVWVTGLAPSGAKGVVLNVTVTAPTAAGFMTVWPGGFTPTVSDLNFVPGETVPNLVVVALSSNGYFEFFTNTGTCEVIVDVFGYYA